MGPSFVDNVITILKVVGIGYLSLTGISLVGLALGLSLRKTLPEGRSNIDPTDTGCHQSRADLRGR